MSYLYAAYLATWVIHAGYLLTLVARYHRLKKDMDEMKNR